MLGIHSSLHVNHCYQQGIMIQLKVHSKISIATAHRLGIHACKANFQSCENNAARVQNHLILHNIVVKGISESAVD